MNKIRQPRIKILFVIGQLPRAGCEMQLWQLLRCIDKTKFVLKVFCLSQNAPLAKDIRKEGIEVFIIPREHNLEFRRLLKLYKLTKAERPNIVHTFMPAANTYGRIAAKLAGVPIIIASERGAINRNSIQTYINRALVSCCNLIVANANYIAKWITGYQKINHRRVITIYNGVDISKFQIKIDADAKRQEIGLNPEEPIVGIVARVHPVKNHKCFLEAARKVLNEYKNTKFVIVGDGPLMNELKAFARELGISGNVIFTSTRNDVPELLLIFDVSVLCSLSEGMPNAVLESMAAGKPVIVTNVGGCPEIVEDGKTGFIVPSNDSTALAGKIMALLANQELANKMGQAGRKHVEANFSINKMVKSYEELYENLIYKRKYE